MWRAESLAIPRLGDFGAIDRGRGFLVDEKQSAHRVVMPVQKEVGLHSVFVLLQVIVTGDDVVDAGHRAVGLADAAVHDEDVAVDLDDGALLAFFVQASEADDSDFVTHGKNPLVLV